MFRELSDVQKNVLDASWLSSLGLGWMVNVDWMMIFGFLIGVITLVVRIWEAKQREREIEASNRASAIKERIFEHEVYHKNKAP